MTNGRKTIGFDGAGRSDSADDSFARARRLGVELAEFIQANCSQNSQAHALVSALLDGLGPAFETAPPVDLPVAASEAMDAQQARIAGARDVGAANTYGPTNPRSVRIVATKLDTTSRRGSLELDVECSGFSGRTGDRVGLCPRNDPEDVRRILRAFNIRGVEVLQSSKGSGPAWRILLEDVEIAHISERARALIVRQQASPDRARLIDEFIGSADPSLLALVRRFPNLGLPLSEVARCLNPLRPILGHVAEAFGSGDATLHVVLSESARDQLEASGMAYAVGAWIPIYIQTEVDRHLGDESELPLVIVADGLGAHLARSYIAERYKLGHRGRCWVIALGSDQDSSLLADLASWNKRGLLSRLDVIPTAAYEMAGALSESQEMLWRWYVDRSAFMLIGETGSVLARLEQRVLELLVVGSKKDHEWFDGQTAERRSLSLYRTLVIE